MKHFSTFILFLFIGFIASAQAPSIKQWDKRFGGMSLEFISSFQQTRDGGYILGGSSNSRINGDVTEDNRGTTGYVFPIGLSCDYWVVKTDSNGNKQWDKRFGGASTDALNSVQPTSDGGYILGGSSNSPISSDRTQPNWDTTSGFNSATEDYWIVKVDSLGIKQWDKRYGTTDRDDLTSVQQTPDGGYILGGTCYDRYATGDKTQASRGCSDYWIIKTDAQGNKQWDKRFGGINYDFLRALNQTADEGYILGGISSSDYVGGDKTQPGWGAKDFWVVKTDSLGNKEWDKRYGGFNDEELQSLLQTTDGGYIFAGWSASGISGDRSEASRGAVYSSDFWIIKTNALGIKQWDKRFGGTENEDEFGQILQTQDRGYLLAGTSYSPISGDKSENNLGLEQPWLLKLDSAGNKQWDKTIFTDAHDEILYVVQPREGCVTVASWTVAGIGGYITHPNWDPTNQTTDYWMAKFCDLDHSECILASPAITTSQTTFCAGDSAQVCALSGFTYHWNTGETTACIKAQLAGNYYVTVTDNNGCTAESNHLAITVYPLPPVSISVNGDTLSVYNAATQQWYLNGSAINNATSNIYIATQGGSYTVAVTDTNGCTATSSPVIISGIDNVTEEDVVSVGQMAVNGWQLAVGNSWLGSVAEVFDVNGRLVFKSEIINHTSEISPALSRGVYLLRISSGKSSVVRKLIRL